MSQTCLFFYQIASIKPFFPIFAATMVSLIFATCEFVDRVRDKAVRLDACIHLKGGGRAGGGVGVSVRWVSEKQTERGPFRQ